jgi:hypothetical protein
MLAATHPDAFSANRACLNEDFAPQLLPCKDAEIVTYCANTH